MVAGGSARREANRLRDQARQLENEAARWEAGALGEERVSQVLRTLPAQTTRVLDDRHLDHGNSDANLDHLVVVPGGVFLIDAKNWGGDQTAYGGSLWHHWTSAAGRQSSNKIDELIKVREMARKVARLAARDVTAVLCLAGDRSASFGPPQDIAGVTVVPIDFLVEWIASRPLVFSAEQVKTVAVELATMFPDAVEPGFTMADAASAPVHEPTHAQRSGPKAPTRQRRSSKQRPAKSRLQPLVRAIVIVAAMIAALAWGPRLISGAVTKAVSAAAPSTSTAAPEPQLPPARLQQLDDWRIRAGLYASNDQPSALAYVPDAALGSWSGACRTQTTTLQGYRANLLAAPDPSLRLSAKQFDVAVTALLSACIRNDPVALHHARTAMSVAATDTNIRYNRLLGIDPSSYKAIHVL